MWFSSKEGGKPIIKSVLSQSTLTQLQGDPLGSGCSIPDGGNFKELMGAILTAHDSIRHQCDPSQDVQKRSNSYSISQSCAHSQFTLASLQDNFMAKNWKKPWWHCASKKTEGLCPQRAAAGI